MAKQFKPSAFFIHFLLLANLVFFVSDARIIKLRKPNSSSSEVLRTLGGIKDSGPSPGEGNKFVDVVKGLGGVKDSGPSPGEGNKYVDVVKGLGGIKESGPSPGEGHEFNKVSETLGGIKDSGPSPGDGHGFVTEMHA